MNYIKHISGFFEKISPDFDLNPTHVSLYMAIFQLWNQNRFHNPIGVNRDELMRISKIASNATFHKCIRELHEKQYIVYRPSHNSFKGSLLDVMPLDCISPLAQNKKTQHLQKQSRSFPAAASKNEQVNEQVNEQGLVKPCTSAELSPYINNTNGTNFVNGHSIENENTECPSELFEAVSSPKKMGGKKGSAGADTIPPQKEEIQSFFVAQGSLEVEAQKFYNHFESNGWLVGGKAKMKDWKAAARNWILHVADYTPSNNKPQAGHLHTPIQKNYDEPL